MTCNFETEVDVKLEFDYVETFERIVDTFLNVEKCPYEVSVDLLYTDDEEIQSINNDTRGIDASTDVLSFPMNDFDTPGDYSKLEDYPDAFDPESGELLLGDIVLSQDHIIKQAEEYNHSILREYAFLIVHSLLHLTGYDHMTDSDRLLMEDRQRVIMSELNILR